MSDSYFPSYPQSFPQKLISPSPPPVRPIAQLPPSSPPTAPEGVRPAARPIVPYFFRTIKALHPFQWVISHRAAWRCAGTGAVPSPGRPFDRHLADAFVARALIVSSLLEPDSASPVRHAKPVRRPSLSDLRAAHTRLRLRTARANRRWAENKRQPPALAGGWVGIVGFSFERLRRRGGGAGPGRPGPSGPGRRWRAPGRRCRR